MKKLVIVGAGFAGLRLAKKLKNKGFEIWLIDRNNFYQFQPLFYQVATSGLEPSAIIFPLRKVFQKHSHIHIRCTEVNKVNSEGKYIETNIGKIDFDYLVLATGTKTNFFGNEQIAQSALPMKSVSEALFLRNTLLQHLEDALVSDKKIIPSLMSVVIVGGGPTGVEISGALAEMKKHILPKDYPELDFNCMNIYLVEAGTKLLANMSNEASEKARSYLEKLGVKVLTSTQVVSYDGSVVKFSSGEVFNTHNLIWAAGVVANSIEGIPVSSLTKGNRILVNRYNQINGMPNVFAIGDLAFMTTDKYPNAHPQVATVANEQADLLAINLIRNEKNEPLKEFEYSNKGSMATVGRHLAVVDLPLIKFQGFFAWLFWMFLHLMLILGVKNKILVFINWTWKYFTFDQSLRLIIKPFNKPNTKNE
jgi:NADH:ubiquinone reductase (H+-translocating)